MRQNLSGQSVPKEKIVPFLARTVATSYRLDPVLPGRGIRSGKPALVAASNDGRDNSKGTQGYGAINAPGNDPYVIAVGATNDNAGSISANDVIATYSSTGPTAIDHIVKPDLVTPGNRIVSYQTPGAYLPRQ